MEGKKCLKEKCVEYTHPLPSSRVDMSAQLSFLASYIHRPDQGSQEKPMVRHVSKAGRDALLSSWNMRVEG